MSPRLPSPRQDVRVASVRRALLVFGSALLAPALHAAPPSLPVPSQIFVSAGAAGQPTLAGRTLTVTQQSKRATLNWDSFNIAAGYRVEFDQPGVDSIALNLIHQANPSVINGALHANGEVWLINQNGLVFGKDARVDARGLVASTLDITPDALRLGIAPSAAQGFDGTSFEAARDGEGRVIAGDLRVRAGAELTTNAPNGRVFLFAPNVSNEGLITAADGQVALAAGSEIYLRQPGAGQGSGLLVETGGGGIVTNGADSNAGVGDPGKLLGQIVADRGTATLVGFAVNQLGRVSANSAVRSGGTVRLLARNSRPVGGTSFTEAAGGGSVTLGPNSVTEANPDPSDTAAVVDASTPLHGAVTLTGKTVALQAGSAVEARGGTVAVRASDQGDDNASIQDAAPDSESRIVLAAGSRIDVSGVDAAADPVRNFLEVKLQGAELKDRPVQRDGPLKGQVVTVDLRQSGTLADGSRWLGTPLADLTGSAAAELKRNNLERNSVGGTVTLAAQGGVLMARGAVVDVSGGAVSYAATPLQASQLVRGGRIVDIAQADPLATYDGVFGGYSVVHQKWGPTDQWQMFQGSGSGESPAYLEGKDAGAINLVAPRLALDGTFLGNTRPGLYQRKATDFGLAAPLARPYDQLPRRGQLTLGLAVPDSEPAPRFVTPDVQLQVAEPSLTAGFDALADPLANAFRRVAVDTRWFGPGKLGELTIYSDGAVAVPAGQRLRLGELGRLKVVAGEVMVAGGIDATAGAIDLAARATSNPTDLAPSTGELTLATGASIDVSGRWTNDLAAGPTGSPNPTGALLSDGGVVRLLAQPQLAESSGLRLEQGSSLRADGGGYLNTRGKLVPGAGGTISLVARPDPNGLRFQPALRFDASVSAFGFQQGGNFVLNAGAVCIALTCGPGARDRVDLSPAFFGLAGFGSYDLVATGGGLTVPAGTTLTLRQQNLLPTSDLLGVASGTDVRAFTTPGLLADNLRRPLNLKLSVKAQTPDNQFDNADLLAAGFLDLGTGSLLLGDPGASIALSSETRLRIEGGITAPGGQITATLASGINGSRLQQFLPSQVLWLGDQARLDASGVLVPAFDVRGYRQGTLRDGGVISLAALSGSLVAAPGAELDVRGAQAELDLLQPGQDNPTPERRWIASDSGSVRLSAAESLWNGATLHGEAVAVGARAGSLTVELDAQRRNDATELSLAALGVPVVPRRLEVAAETPGALPEGMGFDTPLPEDGVGLGLQPLAGLVDSGFGDITLRARNYRRATGEALTPGEIAFAGRVDLNASRRLTLDASLLGIEADTRLAAPYVALGNSDNDDNAGAQAVGPGAAPGGAALDVVGDLIDLVGNWQLGGAERASFASTGDIRLRGVQVVNRPQGQLSTFGAGSLSTPASLTFEAERLYPTTLSHYALSATDPAAGSITFDTGTADSPAVPYSVGGRLAANASRIEQHGNLFAPLGEIALAAAEFLGLAPKSLTSTSLGNSELPFGRLELGKDWVYLLDTVGAARTRLVFSPQSNRPADLFPSGSIRLAGHEVALAAGAVIDQAGGGDLLAYEFQPGLRGSLDPLANASSYALVPQLGSAWAPVDPQEYQGFGLAPGEAVDLSASLPGLPAGRYALLPAHYALLPGAFLISPIAGYRDLAAGTSLPLAGQGTVVAGRRAFADGAQGDSRTSGFLLRAASDIAQLGSFSLAQASTFEGLVGQARPADAGSLALTATGSLDLSASYKGAPAAGGAGSRVEIAGQSLRVLPSLGGYTPTDGVLGLSAAQLSGFGAASLLLGATSEQSGLGTRRLSVTAEQLSIAPGTRLAAPELVLAARDLVELEAGATVAATGVGASSPADITVEGDGALLRISAGGQARLVRQSEAGSLGRLALDEGSSLIASGATLFDASRDFSLDGALSLGGALALSASRISLGDPATPVEGLLLDTARLSRLEPSALTLSARRGIDFFGTVDLAIQSLALEAPGIGGYGEAEVRLTTADFRLANPDGLAYVQAGGGAPGGRFDLTSDRLVLAGSGSGAFRFAGFEQVRLGASQRLLAENSTRLRLDGAVDLATPLLTVTGGNALDIAAQGLLTVTGEGTARPTLPEAAGGRISLAGTRVVVDTAVAAPGGYIGLAATGPGAGDGLELGAGASLDVAGEAQDFAGKWVTTAGGTLALQAANGDLVASSDATLNLGGSPRGGNAGALELTVPRGQLDFGARLLAATATPDDKGAALILDLAALDSPDALGTLLGTFSRAGFNAGLDARIRSGDVAIGAGEELRAGNIRVVVDAGDLMVDGILDASGPQGGTIRLAASGAITVGGYLDAHASEAAGKPGRIDLLTAAATDGSVVAGAIRLEEASLVDAGEAGVLRLRLPRATLAALPEAVPGDERLVLAGQVQAGGGTLVEAFRAYLAEHLGPAEVGSTESTFYQDAAIFMQDLPRIIAVLGEGLGLRVQPGVEVRSAAASATAPGADLSLDAIWDLSNWRFADEPGVLNLRAAGNLTLNDILSDGFAGTADLANAAEGVSLRCASPEACGERPSSLPALQAGDSWSLHLVAGAALDSADPYAWSAPSERLRDGELVGNLVIAGGTPSQLVPATPSRSPVQRPILNAVRTGTGSIDLRAASNLMLGNRAAVVYTAGQAAEDGVALGAFGVAGRYTLGQRPWLTGGGDIYLAAGGSIDGIDPALPFDEANRSFFPTQLPSSWLLRQGNEQLATGWTPAPELFESGIATLGGGDVTVRAGGDIRNLSVAAVASGMQVGGTTPDTSIVRVIGGGDVDVAAQGDLLGGVFHVGRGAGRLAAGGAIGSAHPVIPGAEAPLDVVLSMQDARMDLVAGGNLSLGAAINPTFTPQGPFQKQLGIGRQNNSYFVSYGEQSALRLQAATGDINLRDPSLLEAGAFDVNLGLLIDAQTLRFAPPRLEATALRGNLFHEGGLTLYPSPAGNLVLQAGRSVYFGAPLVLGDIDPAALPGTTSPQSYSVAEVASTLLAAIDPQNPTQALALRPTHLGHDDELARIVAASGDIVSAEGAQLFLSRPAFISAGGNLLNPDFVIEHTDADDVSVMKARGDLRYESPRVATDALIGAAGSLLTASNAIEVWGPGRLVLEAGSDIDLGTAGGAISRGSSLNAALAGEGAAISVFAGLGGSGLSLAPFIDKYFTVGSTYVDRLTEELRVQGGEPGLTPAEALARFRSEPTTAQLGTVLDAFFEELRLTGRAAASTRNPDYTRGDTAVRTLLPATDYAGDLNLYFSQIFTIAGGDIDLLVPGGDINVGLATPPASFGISKGASQLGVVTEGLGDVRAYLSGDFDVNESRVFAADGGSILVWSNLGDIDAGRGARSAISIPANGFQFDNEGRLSISVPPPIQGSGIRALTTTAGRAFGSVDLVTPRGVVNASEAGIESAGNITIAAVEVLGSENIKAGGSSVGVPVSSIGSIGASVAGAAGAANAASKAASDAAAGAASGESTNSAGLGGAAMPIVTVEFLGFGEG